MVSMQTKPISNHPITTSFKGKICAILKCRDLKPQIIDRAYKPIKNG